MKFKIAAIVALLATLAFVSGIDTPEGLLSKSCLRCICNIMTGCNTTIGCDDAAGTCGPYAIQWGYWYDSGRPKPNHSTSGLQHNGFRECTSDVHCSMRTVQGYMSRYFRDCNNDNVVDCQDHVRIHTMGPFSCHNILPKKYEAGLKNCDKDS